MQQTADDLLNERWSESEREAWKKHKGTKIGSINVNCSRDAEGAPSLSDTFGSSEHNGEIS